MITIDVDPVLIHLGGFALTWYGVALTVAIAVGVWLVLREVGRKGLPVDAVMDLVLWVILGGIVGARLLHVIDRWDFYSAQPLQILAIFNGGLAILGAIIGGGLAAAIGAWRKGISVRKLFDAIAPGLILAQAIGRFGCLVTGDAVGRPTDGSWGLVYTNPGAMVPKLGVAYEPVFFFEQVWDLAIFAVLWLLRKRLRGDGQLFAIYLGLYGAGKFALSFMRTEVIWLWGLQEAQIFALGAIAFGLAWGIWGRGQRQTSKSGTFARSPLT